MIFLVKIPGAQSGLYFVYTMLYYVYTLYFTLLIITQPQSSDNNSDSASSNKKLKVVSTTFLLVCFLSLNKNTCQSRKNVFYFTSKALFVHEKIKF